MRIAMISEHASPLAVLGGVDAGGQNVHVAELSTALARRGHDVVVYTRRDDESLPDRVHFADGVEVVNVTAGPARPVPKDDLLPHLPALAAGVASDWTFARPDIAHGHFWMSGVATLDAARRTRARGIRRRVPVVQTFHALGTVKRRHQGAEDSSPTQRRDLEPWVGRTVDTVLATCSDEVQELLAMGVPAASIEVAPCGVDASALTPAGPTAARGPRLRIGVVGRLVPRKGADLAIRALALLPRDDVELVIAGGPAADRLDDDPEHARLRAVAVECGVADRVQFVGAVAHDRLGELLRSLDALVCAPWYEPFGIVPLEAMACGVPVVGAAVGGLLDTVVDGVTGILVPPRDPLAIAGALDRMLESPELRRRLGAAARERVEREYTWERVAELTEGVYERALAGRAALGSRPVVAASTAAAVAL